MYYVTELYGQNVAVQMQDFVFWTIQSLVLNLKSQDEFLQDEGHFQWVNIGNHHSPFQPCTCMFRFTLV